MEQATYPSFRLCQFALDSKGTITGASADSADRLCAPERQVEGRNIRDLLLSIEGGWAKLLPENIALWPEEVFLPWEGEGARFAAGLSAHLLRCGAGIVLTLAPALAPAEGMAQASLQDLPHDPSTVGQLFLRLRTAESRLNNYLHNFPGIFFSQRPDFSFSYLGPGLSDKLEMNTRPLMRNGSQFLDLILKADRAGFLKDIEQSSIRSESFSINYRLKSPVTGSVVYIMDVRTPRLSPGGLLLGYEGVLIDITRQSIAEARLSRSAWKENLATITSGLIHDFSNVMAGIFSLSELYCSSLDKEHPWQRGMHQIMESSREARKLVRRIIDLNREVAGQKNYFNLENLLGEQMDLIRAVLPKHTKIDLVLTGEELPVYLDDVSFRQTILNLAINSRDAIERDGRICIKVGRIAEGEILFDKAPGFTAPCPREGVLIEFSDNGCGIPQELQSRIWDPFFTTKEATRGSGFGLYNARLFITQSKGRIAVHSETGKGTVFYIYLPLADFSENLCDEQMLGECDQRRRPCVAVLSSADTAAFDIVGRMHEREWELICFKRPEAMRRYLREAPRCPDLLLTILLGADGVDVALVRELQMAHPKMRFALIASGRSLEEQAHEALSCMDLAMEDNGAPDEILQQLGSLLSTGV